MRYAKQKAAMRIAHAIKSEHENFAAALKAAWKWTNETGVSKAYLKEGYKIEVVKTSVLKESVYFETFSQERIIRAKKRYDAGNASLQ